MKKGILLPLALLGVCVSLSSCSERAPSVRILNPDLVSILLGGECNIQVETKGCAGKIEYRIQGIPYARVSDTGSLSAVKAGTTTVVASIGEAFDSVAVQVIDPSMDLGDWGMVPKKATCRVGDRVDLSPYIETQEWRYLCTEMVPVLVSDPSIASFEGTTLVAKSPGEAVFAAKLLNLVSDFQSLTILG